VKETIWHRLVHGVRRLRQQPNWARFAGPDWADRIMGVAVTDRFHVKQGRSIGRWVLQSEDQRLVVYLKRHYRLPWWRGLLAVLRPGTSWSPAMQEWEHLEWARAHGMPVPVPLAGGEYIGPWGRLQSFLAVEELSGMLPLHQAIPLAAARLDSRTFRRWKRGLITEMVRLTREFHRRRWFHKDLYLCHFYIPQTDTAHLPRWRGRVRLIDLHRLGRHRWRWRKWQAKDLAQLLYSSDIPGVEARDRLYFWLRYAEGEGGGLAARCFLGVVRLKAWRYRRHNRGT
jgi:heptose I phosphotransferase